MGTTDESVRLFIKPNPKYNNPVQPRYHTNCPIGMNIGTNIKIMSEFSNLAKILTRYIDHCART